MNSLITGPLIKSWCCNLKISKSFTWISSAVAGKKLGLSYIEQKRLKLHCGLYKYLVELKKSFEDKMDRLFGSVVNEIPDRKDDLRVVKAVLRFGVFVNFVQLELLDFQRESRDPGLLLKPN